ncbi:acyl-CoA thioesterase [Streptomyces ovatisporus]|uniref:Acyl-CoA thioesterase n=1 Tax=Streptomyces ovatisporus TaxID=1128682 RepID=A0ABV9A263_9ACTN
MAEQFSVTVTVRGYETDAQGHVNQSVYLQYAEHSRWMILDAAGIRQADLLAEGVGPVVLETTVKYRRELRAGDEVRISCEFDWDEGKTFRVRHEILGPDGECAARVDSVGGVMDLERRRLVADPRRPFLKLAARPELMGL